jgi:BioD-like phosphotransacetylase family protein
VLLTGLVPPSKRVLEALKNSTLPSLYAEVSAYDAMREIHHFTAKIREEDAYKITKAMRHVEPHIDFTKLLEGY